MLRVILISLLAAISPAAADEVRIDGSVGPLGGAMILPEGAKTIAVIIPGSGPTDRDGNSPSGLKTDAYKLLAEGLAEAGIATIRVDKRGMFSSASEGVDPNQATIKGYAADVEDWAAEASRRAGADCAWVIGHSAGGLMALVAAQDEAVRICGLVFLAAPGRPLGVILREQLGANPANASILEGALGAIDKLEAGEHVSFPIWEITLRRLFPKEVQDFMIDAFAQDPAALIATTTRPVLIVQGTRDIQIGLTDAKALKAARPAAGLIVLDGMTHTLKSVDSDDRETNGLTYTDPSLPLHPGLVPAIVEFLIKNDG